MYDTHIHLIMKKLIIIICILFLSIIGYSLFERSTSFPALEDIEFDKGSKIEIEKLNNDQIKNLKLLGQTWGFLKYYHSQIAAGLYNWDYELFRILPPVLQAKDKSELDKILIKWIGSLGEFEKGKTEKYNQSDIKVEPDLSWIKQSGFSSELSELLIDIQDSKKAKDHYYISLLPNVGNPKFKNEKAYADMKYPDAGFRLLSLYRYWNIIQYYFPYIYLIEEDWNMVLEEFIPKVIAAKNEMEYNLVILELITRVQDTHANITGENASIKKYFGDRKSALKVSFVEDKALIVDYYHDEFGKETGLQIGDIIESVNGILVSQIIENQLKYTPASNYTIKLRNIARNLLKSNDGLLQIDYIRNGEKGRKSILTYSAEELDIKNQAKDSSFKMISKDIAYIHHGALKRAHLPIIWKEIKNTKGLIIDCRNYPSDFPLFSLSILLMPKPYPFVKFSNPKIESPGHFIFVDAIEVGKNNKKHYQGKVIILVNEVSQSSSEYHAMAYRVHPNATVIGSTTAGADGNISRFSLPGGIKTRITGIGVYYPDGTETQRIGIIPDIEMNPTIKGIREGRDELMEKAIEVIMEK